MSTDPNLDFLGQELTPEEEKTLQGEAELQDATPGSLETSEVPPPQEEPAPDLRERQYEPEEEPEAPQQKHVPLAALQEERRFRQMSDQRQRELELQNARMAERLQMFEQQHQRQQPQQPEVQAPPDPQQDIFAAIRYQQEQLQRHSELIENYQRAFQQEEQKRWALATAQTQVARFAEKQTDYPEAYKYYTRSRMAEMQAMGIPEEEMLQRWEDEERGLINYTLQKRINPGQALYQLALARGYQPRSAGAPDAPASPQAERHLQQIAQGQQVQRTLSDTGAKSNNGARMTADQLLRMSDEEFDAYSEKNPRALDKLLGK